MSNRGLEIALNKLDMPFLRVDVGSHHVVEALLKNNWLLGGEPSGHITYLRMNTTDDGIIAALLTLRTMHMTGKNLHELKQGITKFPQRVINIPHNGSIIDLQHADIVNFLKSVEKKLGKHSRVLLRYSGTEDVIKAMIEVRTKSLLMMLFRN